MSTCLHVSGTATLYGRTGDDGAQIARPHPQCCAQHILADRLWSLKGALEPQEATFEVLFCTGDVVHAMVVQSAEVVTEAKDTRQCSYETLQIRCVLGGKPCGGQRGPPDNAKVS